MTSTHRGPQTRILTRALPMLALFILASPLARAQEHQHGDSERKPANILPAEMANILLMESRDALEQPEKTLDALGLKDGDLIADMGCGNGYYTLRLAKRVAPHGHVFAVDVQQGMLDRLITRAAEAGLSNIYPILGTTEDPKLPPGKIDWLLLVDVYHEFADPKAMLKEIRKCLAPNGKVALLEYRLEQDPSEMPAFIPSDHKMSVEQVMKEWEPAGFELVKRHEFLPAQHLFIFQAKKD